MEEWSTYGLEDFLLFSPRTYWRLFELHNAALWPLQVPVVLAGVGLLVLLLRPRPWSGRAASILLAAGWLAAAWFLWQRYAAINWAVTYVVPLFLLQAVLLAVADLETRRSCRRRWIAGAGLLAYAIILHPLLAPLAGRPLQGAELALLAPDPTAIATLGAALLAGSGHLGVIPTLWCLASGLTLLAMGSPQAWVMGAALAVLVVGAWPRTAVERS